MAGTLTGLGGEPDGRDDRRPRRRHPAGPSTCSWSATTTRPGMIGMVGTMLGEAGVNIADMDVRPARRRRGRADGARHRLGRPAPTWSRDLGPPRHRLRRPHRTPEPDPHDFDLAATSASGGWAQCGMCCRDGVAGSAGADDIRACDHPAAHRRRATHRCSPNLLCLRAGRFLLFRRASNHRTAAAARSPPMTERDRPAIGDRVIIFDTTLRDGEQSPGISLDVGREARDRRAAGPPRRRLHRGRLPDRQPGRLRGGRGHRHGPSGAR